MTRSNVLTLVADGDGGDGIDYKEAAELAQHAHTELVTLLMGFVDLLDIIQQGDTQPVSEGRKEMSKTIRRSIIEHAIAIGALISETAPEYSADLLDYADTMAHPDQEGGE